MRSRSYGGAIVQRRCSGQLTAEGEDQQAEVFEGGEDGGVFADFSGHYAFGRVATSTRRTKVQGWSLWINWKVQRE